MKKLQLFLFATVFFANVDAQKLPTVQQQSLRAPSNIKIDGKATEWGNQLQAYNNATALYYTIANDNDNLYLVLQTSDEDALLKITNRGIVFNVNTSGKKDDKDAISFLYPYFDIANKPYISFKNKIKIDGKAPKTISDADSVMRSANKRMNDRAKFIKVFGLPAIDTMLSVYNDKGIMAAQLFDNTLMYTYEMAIPLALLKQTGSGGLLSKFSYHIIVPATIAADFMTITYRDNGLPQSIVVRPGAVMPSPEHLAATTSTTDFWGGYTLAK